MKAAVFRQRVLRHGQAVTRLPFSSDAAGSYVDADWGTPDPESATYPTTGSPPGPVYGTAQTLRAFVQPERGVESGRRFVKTPLGDEVAAAARMFVPADTTLTFRDRITVDGLAYWVARVEDWREGGDLVYRLAWLAHEVS